MSDTKLLIATRMIRIIVLSLLFAFTWFSFSSHHSVSAQTNNDQVAIYLFHSKSCPHCKKERAFLSSLDTEALNVTIHEYEVSQNRENARLFQEVGKALDIRVSSVPVTIIGGKVITGYVSDDTTGKQILSAVENARGQP